MKHGLAWVCAVGGLLVGMAEGQPPAPGVAGPALDKTTLAEVHKLQEKRRDVLRDTLAVREKLYQTGRSTLDGIVKTSKQLLAAELELATTGGERIAAHQRHFEKARLWFELAKARHEAGRGEPGEVLDAQAVLLAAEIGLLKAGGKRKHVEK
jgi:outer membrane protein TolC